MYYYVFLWIMFLQDCETMRAYNIFEHVHIYANIGIRANIKAHATLAKG